MGRVPLVVLLVGVLVGAPSTASPRDAGATPVVTVGPLISGTASYVEGTYAWTDHAYDDRGPDTDDEPGGDASYDQAPGNLADLIQVQIADRGGALRFRAVLQTLLDPEVPLVGYGLDLDADPATGAATLPGGAWTVDGPLGVERVVLVSADGAEILAHRDGAWEVVGEVGARVDPATNVLAVDVPHALVPTIGDALRVVAAAGLAGDRSWAHGGGPVFDLAFVGDEPHRGWQDRHQAQVLAGARPSDRGVAEVDLELLRHRQTQLASATEPGFHTLLYRSSLDLPEGIRDFTITGPGGQGEFPISDLYAGPYQPYVIRIPDAPLPERPPVLLYLHGIETTHIGILDQFREGAGFDPPAIVVFPLGRGETTFYIGSAEQDVLDVLGDVTARYDADPDRIALSGRSMGGFGTFRFGVRYPDRWSTMTAFIGTGASAQSQFSVLPPEVIDALFSPTRFPAGNRELLENVRNVPVRMVNGQLDPIVNDLFPEQDAMRLDELGYEHRYWALMRREHEVEPRLSNCLLVEAARAVRETSPAHVTYSVQPAIFMRDPDTGLDLAYRGAWWVTDIAAREDVDDSGEEATVHAVSLAHADREPTRERIIETGENLTHGADLCGPNPDVQTGDAWRLRGLAYTARPPQPTSNALEVSLDRVASVRFDLVDAALDTSRPVEVQVTGDGPARLRLDGGWERPVQVTLDGRDLGTRTPEHGEVVVAADLAGTHTIVLEPRGGNRPAPADRGTRQRLPATGGGAALGAVLFLVAIRMSRWTERRGDR